MQVRFEVCVYVCGVVVVPDQPSRHLPCTIFVAGLFVFALCACVYGGPHSRADR